MKRKFFINTLILTLTSQALRIVGIYFIAFLSSKIGTEGIGLYQLTFSIYYLAATMATSGIGMAVTRLTAEALGKSGGKSTSDVLHRCVALSLFLSAAVAAALFFSAGFIGTSLLGDPRTVLSLKMLAPSLPFMAVSSCLRGYFYGVRKAFKPASEMIVEQIVQILIILCVIDYFAAKGLEYACLAVVLATTAAEVVSCIYSFTLFRVERRRSRLVVSKEKGIGRRIMGIFIPLAAISYMRSGLRTAENVLIPSGLKRYGASHKDALSQYGLLLGMVMPILVFPSSFLSAISTLLIPEISEASAVDNLQKVKSAISRVFKLTLLLSLLFCGMFVFFAGDIGLAIYQNREAGGFLMILAPLVPLIYMDFLVDGMLNALNQQMRTLKINILDYTIRITLILILIPRYGLMAFIAIFYISTVLNACLSIDRLLRVADVKVEIADWIAKPLLAILAAASVTSLVFRLIPGGALPLGIALTAELILTAALYFGFLFMLRSLTKKDMLWFKSVVKGAPKAT
jgi:stage V sporulation protein B